MGRKFLLYGTTALALAVFLCYWAATLLYVTPDNFVRIRSDRIVGFFDMFFCQRWGFFAPPPDSDLFVYYTFSDPDVPEWEKTFEALTPIYAEKRRTTPFNEEAQVMDYLISSSATSINDLIAKYAGYSRVAYPDETDEFHARKTVELVNGAGERFPGYLTLVRYARHIAARQGLDAERLRVKIRIAQRRIVPFGERMTSGAPDAGRPIEVIFDTPVLAMSSTTRRE